MPSSYLVCRIVVDSGELRYIRRTAEEEAISRLSAVALILARDPSYLGVSVWLLRRRRLLIAIALRRWWSVVLLAREDVSI